MILPIFKSDDPSSTLMQNKWASILNPVLTNPTTNPSMLKKVSLKTGANTFNHLLGQVQQGWIVSDINAAATLYRSQPFNDKTLTLTSSADCVVTLLVF